MKIINATWEKRNLGCDAYEIQIERKDLKNFSSMMSELKKQDFSGAYVTVKMPVGNLEALHALEDDGFRFMETQYKIKNKIAYYQHPRGFMSVLKDVELETIIKKEDQWEKFILKLTPELFTTDRIYLDPVLNINMSAMRYQNWMRDLVGKEDTKLIIIKYRKKAFGFHLFRCDYENGILDGILGGIFPEFKNTPLGFIWYAVIYEYGKQNGFSFFEGAFSSNNLSVFKLFMQSGSSCYDTSYVLRKKYS